MENVVMPKLGLTMEEGCLTKWLVSVGDIIEVGDELCEVETDKITSIVEAKVGGTLREILVEEGDEVPVFTVLAVIN